MFCIFQYAENLVTVLKWWRDFMNELFGQQAFTVQGVTLVLVTRASLCLLVLKEMPPDADAPLQIPLCVTTAMKALMYAVHFSITFETAAPTTFFQITPEGPPPLPPPPFWGRDSGRMTSLKFCRFFTNCPECRGILR